MKLILFCTTFLAAISASNSSNNLPIYNFPDDIFFRIFLVNPLFPFKFATLCRRLWAFTQRYAERITGAELYDHFYKESEMEKKHIGALVRVYNLFNQGNFTLRDRLGIPNFEERAFELILADSHEPVKVLVNREEAFTWSDSAPFLKSLVQYEETNRHPRLKLFILEILAALIEKHCDSVDALEQMYRI